MALVYEFVWRLLHVCLHIHRTLVSWFRSRLRSWDGRLWTRALAALLVPIALGFPDRRKKTAAVPVKRSSSSGRRSCRWGADGDGASLEKLPVHLGLLIAEEEPSYTDVANLVVWCMAVGVSYISVYDNQGVLRRNSSRLQEEIYRQQQDLLGPEGSKYSVELLGNGTDKRDHQVSCCRPVVRVLSPEDGKPSIVQAARRLCRDVEQRERRPQDIDLPLLESLLRESKSNIPDPDLVLKFGPVESTLGFLPWQIRLTEFISLPTHLDVSYEDLFGALQRFAGCEQRVGK